MKTKLIIFSTVVLVFCASQVFAHEGEEHDESKEDKGSMMEHKGSVVEEHHSELPNVGNKICPVSGEVIADVGDGKGVQVEHEGKVYNFCCSMCAKDFKKNPEKFIKKINEELEGSEHEEHGDHEEHEESDEDAHKGSGHDDHGDHDH